LSTKKRSHFVLTRNLPGRNLEWGISLPHRKVVGGGWWVVGEKKVGWSRNIQYGEVGG